jgi:hypothetical protein
VLAPITMGAPGGAATQHFTAKYMYQDPDALYDDALHDPSLHHISGCEYWILDRTNSSASVNVTLSYDSVRSCGVTDLTSLAVARWNGGMWKDHGNGGVTGTLAAGTIVTLGTVSSFSPFTLASRNNMNPLPIELLSFTAVSRGEVVLTEWVTASERDNDHFEVERSADGSLFEPVGTLPGAGDSQSELHYALTDEVPLSGMSYYRLKQVDHDGAFTYSDVVPVFRNSAVSAAVRVFPNPTIGAATLVVQDASEGAMTVLVTNAQGQAVSLITQVIAAGDVAVPIDLDGLPAGMYAVHVQQADGRVDDIRVMKQ